MESLGVSCKVRELPTETEKVAWPQAWWVVMKSVMLRNTREALSPIPTLQPLTGSLTGSASFTW